MCARSKFMKSEYKIIYSNNIFDFRKMLSEYEDLGWTKSELSDISRDDIIRSNNFLYRRFIKRTGNK